MSQTLLARIERKAGDSSAYRILFSNIPQNYTDLKAVISIRVSTKSPDNTWVLVNDSFTSSARVLTGNGSSVNSEFLDLNAGWHNGVSDTTNTFSNTEVYFANYSNTSFQGKGYSFTSVSENNAATAYQRIGAGAYPSSTAITQLSFELPSGDMEIGSSISLYGINRQQAIGKPKAIGGNITFANGYWVHTFNGSGTFYALENLDCEYLVAAGGGGSAGYYAQSGYNGLGGGGGGAGGLLNGFATILSNSTNHVIVGSGGAATNNGVRFRGENSSFMSNIALGGGGAGIIAYGQREASTGLSGGSGGGGSANTDPFNGLSGPGTAGQGFSGGNGGSGTVASGGGGGGATAAGGNGSNGSDTVGGPGGAGFNSSITGLSTTYSRGGNGGGRSGESAGSANTGNGANGRNIVTNGYVPDGFPGGSGIVIIRYPA
jgi:hypothetical protein